MTRKSYDEKAEAFTRLIKIMDELRVQCPWDKKQTFETLRNLTVEETYELADAIAEKDVEGIREEVGDLLLHMAFYSRLGEEAGVFDIADALNEECEKLIRRHPHIYGDTSVNGEEDVKKNWETIKMQEGKKSVLSGVPNSLPAMIKAYRMQDKTKQVGFEWENEHQVWEKVEEEIAEFKEVVDTGASQDKVDDEFGDILFSLINYARFKGIDPELALEKVNRKFKSRFEYIEANANRPLEDMTLTEMDELWNQAKSLQK